MVWNPGLVSHTAESSPISPCLLPLDEWGPITVDKKLLLDAGCLWSVTFDDYVRVARAGGAPLINVSSEAISQGVVTVERVVDAVSPVVHRVLVAASSTLDSTGSFGLSLAGVITRPISVDVSASSLQHVSAVCKYDSSS